MEIVSQTKSITIAKVFIIMQPEKTVDYGKSKVCLFMFLLEHSDRTHNCATNKCDGVREATKHGGRINVILGCYFNCYKKIEANYSTSCGISKI